MPFPREVDEGRAMRGQEIAKVEGQIKRLDDSTYQVSSQSGHGLYTVVKGSRDWRCSCPDHVYREVKCKHIYACEFSLKLRNKVRENVVIEPVQSTHASTANPRTSRKTGYGTTSTEQSDFQLQIMWSILHGESWVSRR